MNVSPESPDNQHYCLAQVNIAKAVAPLEDPAMQGFVEQLDAINQLAENSPGFLWRLKTDTGDATSIQLYDDPAIITNISLWRSLDDLKAYVYKGDHLAALREKKQWFSPLNGPSLALWWVPVGHTPTEAEGKRALQELAEYGPTNDAFTFARPFPPPA